MVIYEELPYVFKGDWGNITTSKELGIFEEVFGFGMILNFSTPK